MGVKGGPPVPLACHPRGMPSDTLGPTCTQYVCACVVSREGPTRPVKDPALRLRLSTGRVGPGRIGARHVNLAVSQLVHSWISDMSNVEGRSCLG